MPRHEGDVLRKALELIERLAPEEPINQDERGGCVWCGGRPPDSSYGYATADPSHHNNDCAWLDGRTFLRDEGSAMR